VTERLAFGFALALNHPPDVADAFGALQPSSAVAEHVDWTRRALVQGCANVALPNAVTVANVHQSLRGDDHFSLSDTRLGPLLQLIRINCDELRRPRPNPAPDNSP
jgi:hypothetical protein